MIRKAALPIPRASRSQNRFRAHSSLVVFCCAALAQGAGTQDARNLALGKPCSLVPAPNYGHCTDAGDAAPYIDIWCPALFGAEQRPAQMAEIRKSGGTVWSYSVFHGRHSPPYEECRLTLWRAFKHGAAGCGFWCYAQGGSWQDDNLWDDFNDRYSDYAVIYTLKGAPEDVSRAEPIIPSKRWEAWREHVEDYVYLHMLKTASAAERSDPPVPAAQARAELEAALADVLTDPEDVTRADRRRQRVLRLLAEAGARK